MNQSQSWKKNASSQNVKNSSLKSAVKKKGCGCGSNKKSSS